MFATGWRSEADAAALSSSASSSSSPPASSDPLARIRARGSVRLIAHRRGVATVRANVREEGASRLRFPRERLNRLDAVIVNVAGGIAGGDRFEAYVEAREDTRIAISTVAAEKVYRSAGDVAHVDVHLQIGPRARLAWLPQETIVFDRAKLSRRIDVAMASDASLTLCESTILGRAAMGETVSDLDWRERWSIRRGGRLVFADAVMLRGDIRGTLARKAIAGGARAFATLIHASSQATDLCEPLREALATHTDCEHGVSTFDDLVVVRFLAMHGHALRKAMMAALACLPDAALPRSWAT